MGLAQSQPANVKQPHSVALHWMQVVLQAMWPLQSARDENRGMSASLMGMQKGVSPQSRMQVSQGLGHCRLKKPCSAASHTC